MATRRERMGLSGAEYRVWRRWCQAALRQRLRGRLRDDTEWPPWDEVEARFLEIVLQSRQEVG